MQIFPIGGRGFVGSTARAAASWARGTPLVLDLAADAMPVTVTAGCSASLHSPSACGAKTQCHNVTGTVPISSTRPATSMPTQRSGTARLRRTPRARDHRGHEPRRPVCCQERIWSVFAAKPGLTRRAGPPVGDRQFTAHGANRVWLTNITEVMLHDYIYCNPRIILRQMF